MRILSKEKAKNADVDFIYGMGNALAIVSADFDEKYDIKPKKEALRKPEGGG